MAHDSYTFIFTSSFLRTSSSNCIKFLYTYTYCHRIMIDQLDVFHNSQLFTILQKCIFSWNNWCNDFRITPCWMVARASMFYETHKLFSNTSVISGPPGYGHCRSQSVTEMRGHPTPTCSIIVFVDNVNIRITDV